MTPKKDQIAEFRKILLSDSHGAVIKQEDLNEIGIYNFSYGSDNYRDMLFKIYFLNKINPNLDTILITVDNHTLSKYRENFNNIDRSIFYLDNNLDIPRLLKYSKIELLFLKSYFFLPLFRTNNSKLFYAYIKSKLDFLLQKNKNNSLKEWSMLDAESKIKKCKERFLMQFSEREGSNMEMEALEEIIDYCNKNNIKIIGFKFPLSKQYLIMLNNVNYGADSILYKKNIPIIDLQDEFIEYDEYFSDQDHMNDFGSKEFCRILNRKLQGF
jgi:hypothetical protein